MSVHRWLAVVMSGVGVLAGTYAVVAYVASADPLRGLLLGMIAVPAVIPIVFGALMFRGRRWAVGVLRAYLLVLLALGAWLHVAVGLSVFAPATFGVPFVGACLVWLVMSFVPDRRTAQ